MEEFNTVAVCDAYFDPENFNFDKEEELDQLFNDLESEALADGDKEDSNSKSKADGAEKEEYKTTQLMTETVMEPTKATRNRVSFL